MTELKEMGNALSQSRNSDFGLADKKIQKKGAEKGDYALVLLKVI